MDWFWRGSRMAYHFTPEEIAEMKAFLQAHPPDPAWDWADDVFDAPIPPDEFKARCVRAILEDLGELPASDN